jgi:hypothetical protein
MSLTVHVDGPRWAAHHDRVAAAFPGLVPVVKGNGYGFGATACGKAAVRLGVDTVAVGTVGELTDVAAAFPGQLLLLEPWHPRTSPSLAALSAVVSLDRLILTVADRDALAALAAAVPASGVDVVVEAETSMARFGMTGPQLAEAVGASVVGSAIADDRLRLRGLALHLPLTQPAIRHIGLLTDDGSNASGRELEAIGGRAGWQQALALLDSRPNGEVDTLWLSHLTADEAETVTRVLGDVPLRHRIGSRLWLDAGSFHVTATVLAVHAVRRARHVGYRQRRTPSNGHVLVVSGGTTHGIGLTAPTAAASVRQRGIAAATGLLDAAGRAKSPFSWRGHRLWFVEPPHAQVSMVWLPHDVEPPTVGDLAEATVRMTTLHADEVVVSPLLPGPGSAVGSSAT